MQIHFNVKVRATTLGPASLEQSEVSADCSENIFATSLNQTITMSYHNTLILLQIEANSLHTHSHITKDDGHPGMLNSSSNSMISRTNAYSYTPTILQCCSAV